MQDFDLTCELRQLQKDYYRPTAVKDLSVDSTVCDAELICCK